jgi:eukaryotic-like serine/threonine-protein kinase
MYLLGVSEGDSPQGGLVPTQHVPESDEPKTQTNAASENATLTEDSAESELISTTTTKPTPRPLPPSTQPPTKSIEWSTPPPRTSTSSTTAPTKVTTKVTTKATPTNTVGEAKPPTFLGTFSHFFKLFLKF